MFRLICFLTITSAVLAGKSSHINFGSFRCPREEKALEKCLKDKLNQYIPRLAKGVPEYNVPSCEPILVPEVSFQQMKGPVLVTSTYSEVAVRGPSTMKIQDLSIDSDSDSIVAKVYIPQLKLKGKYKIDGKILLLPISGEGIFSGVYDDINANVTIVLGRVSTAEGADALKCEDLTVRFDVQKAQMQMDNLFGGDEQMGKTMNKFLNENWEKVGGELQPVMENSLRDFLRPLADQAFSNIKADDIFGN